MRYILIVYLFGAININIFNYIFGQTLDISAKNAPRIAFFLGQR
jgi:hypothetical protein